MKVSNIKMVKYINGINSSEILQPNNYGLNSV